MTDVARSLARKSRSFYRLPLFVKVWFFPTLALLLISKMMIFIFSFRRISKLLGETLGADPFLPLLRPDQKNYAVLIAMTVNLAARYLPLGKDCFPKAVTARILLGVYGVPYCVFFGVKRTGDGIKAHAWVFSGAHCVCGGRRSFWRYRVLNVVASPGLINTDG